MLAGYGHRAYSEGTQSARHGPRDFEVSELGDGVGFRPQPDPSLCERLVLVIQQSSTVEVGLDLPHRHDDTNRVPHPKLGLVHPRRRDRAPLAVHDRVETEVVLERIGPHEKIVLTVLRAKDDAAARVLFTRYR